MTAARPRALLLASIAAVATACSSESPSTLAPRGPGSRSIAGLWWFMFGISAAVVAVVAIFILAAVRARRRASGAPDETPRWARRVVIGGGVVFPVIVLTSLWVLTVHEMSALSEPPRPAAMLVDVRGHQWWWEVRYPAQRIVDANDIHIPVGRPVRLRLTTADVIHSFWVPQLTAKMDMISGRVNTIWLQADRPGIYRGQCAEYCGLQHANMAFYVIALAPREFASWLAQATAVAPEPPAQPLLARGEQVFVSSACAACHTIDGTQAHGRVGPDLTHFGSRRTIGAGTIPNTAGALGGWIVNSQAIKPGNIMPPVELPAQDVRALIAYLESLR